MQEVFEKIIERLEEENRRLKSLRNNCIALSDSEVNAIENKAYNFSIEIVKQEAEKYDNGWIPVSERLPKERDWYLAVFEEVDTGFIIGIPYVAEYLMGARTMYTTTDGWIIRNCTDTDGGSSEYYKNLKCVAWHPLPQPYHPKEEHDEILDKKQVSEIMNGTIPVIEIDKAIEIVKQESEQYTDGWIPCSVSMPEERDSMFAKFKGTKMWNDSMFEKISEEVNVTVSTEKGTKVTTHAHTTDGKWKCDLLRFNTGYRIIAWQPLPQPYQPKGDNDENTN